MPRQSRFPNLFATLKRPFSSRRRFSLQQSRANRARRLGLECLEERKVMAASFLGQIGGPGDQFFSNKQEMDAVGNMYVDGWFNQTADFDPGIELCL